LRSASAAALAALLLAGCGSTDPVKPDVLHGIELMQSKESPRRLRDKARETIARLQADRPRSADGRKAKRLALRALSSWQRGLRARIAFVENDSGNIWAATRDAKAAYRAHAEAVFYMLKAARVYRVPIRLESLNR
jgi:hypothetical protein